MPKRNENLSKVVWDAIHRQEKLIKRLEDEDKSARDITEAQKVLGALVNQGRALVKDGRRWAEKLTPEEQREAVVSWFEALPQQQQRLFLQAMARTHNEQAATTAEAR